MTFPEPDTATRPAARGFSLGVRKLPLIACLAALACAPAAHAANAGKTRLTIMGAGFGGTVIALWEGSPPPDWTSLDPGRPAWAEVVR